MRREGEMNKKKKVIKYKISDSDKDYMIFTNNLYESRISKSIYTKQSQYFSDFHRKLRISSSHKLQRTYDQTSSHLNLPMTYNYHSKITEHMLPNKVCTFLFHLLPSLVLSASLWMLIMLCLMRQRKRVDEVDSPIYNILFNSDGSQLLVTTKVLLFNS